MKLLGKTVLAWLPVGLGITFLSILVYGTVQQNYRESLNDPQVQMAEDAGYALSKGDVPADVVPRTTPVDMRLSLAPWIAVYDSTGMPLESSAVLDGAPPQPPKNVLDAAANGTGKDSPNTDENRITWQPSSGVRQAIVVVAVPGESGPKYFVVAGRNMREVEDREGRLSTMVGLGFLAALIASFIAMFAVMHLGRRQA